MGGKCREWDGKAWVPQGGAPKMIYILWKFILSGGGVLFRSPKGFLNGILMLLTMRIIYIINYLGGRAFSQPEGLFEWLIW